MAVSTKYQSAVTSHPADNALIAIEYAIKELQSLGVSSAEITARGNRISNDSALVAAIVAAVSNRNS